MERKKGRTGLDERRLEHVREEGQDRVQRLELVRVGFAVLNTGQELRQDREINDERRRKKRVLVNRSDPSKRQQDGNSPRTR